MGLLLFIPMMILFLFLVHNTMMLESKKWVAIAAISQFTVAFVALLVAVFREWMKVNFPPFSVDVILHRPEGVITELDIGIREPDSNEIRRFRVPTIYYYLQVLNIYPWKPIEQCEVHLAEIWRRGANGEFSRAESFAVPFPLTWAPAISGQRDVTLKTRKLVDFVRVNFPMQCLEPVFVGNEVPNNFDGRIRPGDTYRYYVEVSGKGYTSDDRWGFEFVFDGEWFNNVTELQRRIRLTPLQ